MVLATGLVHVLPDATAALTDPALGECCSCASLFAFCGHYLKRRLCAGWPDYPVSYVTSVVAAITIMAFEGGISAMITKHVREAPPPAVLPDEESSKEQPELTEAQHTKLQAEHSLRVRWIAVAQVGRPS